VLAHYWHTIDPTTKVSAVLRFGLAVPHGVIFTTATSRCARVA